MTMQSDQLKLHRFLDVPEQVDRINKTNRVFLPLEERWYQLFREGKKNWELRGISDIFNTKNIKEGRTVELRRGYQSNPLWGVITERLVVNSFNEIPSKIFDETIPPAVRNDPDVGAFLKSYKEKYDKFILFKIRIVGEG
ncbi:MAG: hypothetical protein WBD09_10560 [Halobacteriota archaeon]